MSWFEQLVGFRETGSAVRELLSVDGDTITSQVNGRVMRAGTLTTPSLAELRSAAERACKAVPGSPTVREVVANVTDLHRDPTNEGAVFQVASQFNLLEMVSPEVTPESGVTGYEHDHTQGPACTIACGAGTIFRNWLVDIDGQIGQTFDRQIDCIADVGDDLDNANDQLWRMVNGYALLTGQEPDDVPTTHPKLHVGVQANTEVTLNADGHLVTQVYCSALPVAYSAVNASAVEPLARMVLNSAYEATMCAAVATGSRRVFLTLLGGGVFGNPADWIIDAIHHALTHMPPAGLDVAIVSHAKSNPALHPLLEQFRP